MVTTNRREFLTGLSSTAIYAGVGTLFAQRMVPGLARAFETQSPLDFGELEPLVALLQNTPTEQLQPALVAKIRQGTSIRSLVIAGGLANARTFGGHDYDGYHIQMALSPALHMSQQLPENLAALPVLKVLHRNSRRTHAAGGGAKLSALGSTDTTLTEQDFLSSARQRNVEEAEQAFAGLLSKSPKNAFATLVRLMLEDLEVHRVVLAWRAYEMWQMSGDEFALTHLRQAIRYCIDQEVKRLERSRPTPEIRTLLPELMTRIKEDNIGRAPPFRRRRGQTRHRDYEEHSCKCRCGGRQGTG